MKWIRNFSKFKESFTYTSSMIIDLKESLLKNHEDLLSSVGKEIDLKSTVKDDDVYSVRSLFLDFVKSDLDELNDSKTDIGANFINSLSSIGLKKSSVQNSLDFENFVNKPCKFMFLYSGESDELENPKYILFQTWFDTLKKWDDLKLFSVESDINSFLNKLTSRTIQITEDGKNYIYETSNGNDWILKNSEDTTEVYKKTLSKEQLQTILDERKIEFVVI
jgi:hypothetical protein